MNSNDESGNRLITTENAFLNCTERRAGLEVSINIAPRSSRIRKKTIHIFVCITRYFMEMRIIITKQ